MMNASGGHFVRTILRAILSLPLLLGGGVGDWAPAAPLGHESCCCGMAAGGEDRCPCPKPDANRTPSRGSCADRQTSVATQATLRRSEQGQRRTEARPEPATWARATESAAIEAVATPARGRDPDLGRHLARLSTFRI